METTQTPLNVPPLFSTTGFPKAEGQTPNAKRFGSISSPLTSKTPLFIPIQVISPELVLVDWGPMTLTLSVWSDNKPRPVMAVQTAKKALDLLERLSDDKFLLKIESIRVRNLTNISPLVRRAISTCQAISPDLTGMAAIAGLVADELVAYALELGGDRIIVNNGGDIALGLKKDQTVRVGLKDPRQETVSHILEVSSGHRIGGIATSGWSGRSFSPGVADAVSVWAQDCLTADAAATWIAGQMKLDSPKVIQEPAEELDPDTDIPHYLITRTVFPLADKEKESVLQVGCAAAKDLIEKRIIQGAFITVQGRYRWISIGEPYPREWIPNQ